MAVLWINAYGARYSRAQDTNWCWLKWELPHSFFLTGVVCGVNSLRITDIGF